MSDLGFTESVAGVCAARGFRAAAVAAGIKASGGPDLVLVVSDTAASVAGAFTTHKACAAPVLLSRERVRTGSSRGVVINSGCANAATGKRGLEDAETMASLAAREIAANEGEVLVCSTGKIGSYLPMDRVSPGIAVAAASLSLADEAAARAILTTDTRPKRAAVAHPSGWTLGGMAKGAGMIAPNMATMLAFLTTDAVIVPERLGGALAPAVAASFNTITVDGEPSTNDTVLAFANGASGVTPSAEEVAGALQCVCLRLAEAIVADGEGATKLIRVRVTGAASPPEAQKAARTVADSLLFKTALYGSDANWGRIYAAIGKSEVTLDLDALSIAMAGVTVCDRGLPVGDHAVRQAEQALKARDIVIDCDLGIGDGAAEILTTDLSRGYVDINAEYEP
ncbi:MAG: bifunctional glutamate N-acetyltransferase/amino-acid acetyltransferase ArgJ [Actinomycetota bacterium]